MLADKSIYHKQYQSSIPHQNTASNPTQLQDSAYSSAALQADPQFHQIHPTATNPFVIGQYILTIVSASRFSSSLRLQGRRQAAHKTTLASLQLVKIQAPVMAPRGDGIRHPHGCMAHRTPPFPKYQIQCQLLGV